MSQRVDVRDLAKKRVAELYKQGVSYKGIASRVLREYGINVSVVSIWKWSKAN